MAQGTAHGVQTLTVSPDEAEVRLDRWFRRRFPELSHGRLEKLLRTGQVRVDGARAKASLRLAAGQAIRIPPLGETPKAAPPAARPPSAEDAAWVQSLVIHRDDHVIAIDKPAGLATQGGTGTTRHLDALLDALRFGAAERPRLVHRLDRDTSGVLLLARSARAAAFLARAFQARESQKTYWAIVVGVPRPERGRIDLALAKHGGPKGERVEADEDGGRRAITDYAVVERAGNRAAWLALRPHTGRTHQLRVHCAALGTPILGDGKYGGKDAELPGATAPRRLHLHAREIVIAHPAGRRLKVAAPLPDFMRETWRFLGFDTKLAGDPFADAPPPP
jgi:23S rRNA pseudouridine955/2504/2580 synthase